MIELQESLIIGLDIVLKICLSIPRTEKETNMKPTDEQMKRLSSDWNRIAGEVMEIEYCKGSIYAFGSELATLRLFKVYAYSTSYHKQAFSENLGKFYFMLELNF